MKLYTQYIDYKIIKNKNMKKTLKYILVVFAFALTACSIDDDPAIVAEASATKNTVQFEKTGTINYPTGSDLVINMASANETDSQVSFKAVKTETDGTITEIKKGVVVFPAGQTRGVLNLEIPFLQEVTVTLSKPVSINNPNMALGDNSSLKLIGSLAASPNSIELAVTNEGAFTGIWFGLSQFRSSGAWVSDYHQNSTDGSPRFMSIPLNGQGNLRAIPNSADVAPNIMALNLYVQRTLPNNPHKFSIYITMPDGSTQVFKGSIPSRRGADNAVVKVLIEDDSNNPGNRKYTFSEL